MAPEVAAPRIAAALTAGGTVVDDSNAPALTVIADQDGNKGIVCVDVSAARRDSTADRGRMSAHVTVTSRPGNGYSASARTGGDPGSAGTGG